MKTSKIIIGSLFIILTFASLIFILTLHDPTVTNYIDSVVFRLIICVLVCGILGMIAFMYSTDFNSRDVKFKLITVTRPNKDKTKLETVYFIDTYKLITYYFLWFSWDKYRWSFGPTYWNIITTTNVKSKQYKRLQYNTEYVENDGYHNGFTSKYKAMKYLVRWAFDIIKYNNRTEFIQVNNVITSTTNTDEVNISDLITRLTPMYNKLNNK